MVSTRRSLARTSPEKSSNRVIALVTGANSGLGEGICNMLLSNLSLPPGTPMPASIPHAAATPPSLRHLLEEEENQFDDAKEVPDDPPPTLTLILAVRTQSNGEAARRDILKRHEEELEKRRKEGHPVRKGWKEGLRIDIQTVDLDQVGGPTGILAFCERIRDTYPYLTSVFLNAGILLANGIDWPRLVWQCLKQGVPYALSRPDFQCEEQGRMSADGERGKTWGINLFANYLIAKEFEPLLRRSPRSLPFAPRIIYTSSSSAERRALNGGDVWDYELTSWKKTYSASKYLATITMCQLDKDFDRSEGNAQVDDAEERSVRVFSADPGCIPTGLVLANFGTWKPFVAVMLFFYGLAFTLSRVLFGSEDHPIDPTDGAVGMVYAALVDEKFILPASKIPGPKYNTTSHRRGPSTVRFSEVEAWEETERIAEDQVKHCETLRKQWRRREGFE